MDVITEEFQAGVNAYWSGELPDGWNSADKRAVSPYLTGWYMASVWETDEGALVDSDGIPFQEVD